MNISKIFKIPLTEGLFYVSYFLVLPFSYLTNNLNLVFVFSFSLLVYLMNFLFVYTSSNINDTAACIALEKHIDREEKE